MTEREVTHSTFVIERVYAAPPSRVWQAWSNEQAKALWFGGGQENWTQLERAFDFRVGGRERAVGRWASGTVSAFDALYWDIIPEQRIVYTYEMHIDDRKISVSLASVELKPEGEGTRLKVTESGAFLDGYDDAGSREHGTGWLMDRLGASLRRAAMSDERIADLVRHYFDSWERADRPALEALLAEDFTFTSPWDDHISKARFFEHCFPHAGTFGFKRPMMIMVDGGDAFIRYETVFKSGGGFRNMEYMRFEDGRLRSIEVFFGFIPGAGEDDAAAAQTGIKALIAERVEAMRTKDVAQAMACMADDAVAFELAPPLRLGPDQARDEKALQAWFDGWQGGVDVEVSRLTVAASGDVGIAHSLNRMRATRTDGSEVDFWMRSTLGLRKQGDQWKIAHGHTSVPFHMDGSFRAALDLEP